MWRHRSEFGLMVIEQLLTNTSHNPRYKCLPSRIVFHSSLYVKIMLIMKMDALVKHYTYNTLFSLKRVQLDNA